MFEFNTQGKVIVLISIVTFLIVGCTQIKSTSLPVAGENAHSINTLPSTVQSELSIKSVKFVRFTDAEMKIDASVNQLETWCSASDGNKKDSPLAVEYQLENPGASAKDVTVSVTESWIIAPRKRYSSADLERMSDEVAWTDDVLLEKGSAIRLEPRRVIDLHLSDLGIKQKISNLSEDGLWPWKVRITIHVEEVEYRLVSKSASLYILPKEACINKS